MRPLLDPSTGRTDAAPLLARTVPPSLHDHRAAAPDYRPDPALTAAVNVALAVGAPLLLTGEPGSGKTALAWYLAWHFQLPPEQPFRMTVKSTSIARDFLWTFDAVAYHHASQSAANRNETLDKSCFRVPGPLWQAFEAIRGGDDRPPVPAIVLVDEIDKAPRDFPNDLLHELDQYSFTCQDTGEVVSRPPGSAPPLVIVTSNAERPLPDAFLRRCVFHHIELDERTVRDAVHRRGATLGAAPDLQDAAFDAFWRLRAVPGLGRAPSTGELLTWLAALHAAGVTGDSLRGAPLGALPFPGVLLKDRGDHARVR